MRTPVQPTPARPIREAFVLGDPLSIRETIGDRSVASFADEFDTPLVAVDLPALQQRLEALAGFDQIRYAITPIDSAALLAFLRSVGVLVSADSATAVESATNGGYVSEASGRPGGLGGELLFSADVFDEAGLSVVLQRHLPVACGSARMISQIGDRRPGSDVTLAVNAGLGAPMGRGIWHTDVDDCLLRADQNGVTVTGIFLPAGLGVDSKGSITQAFDQIAGAAERIAGEIGRTLRMISFGVPQDAGSEFVASLAKACNSARDRLSDRFGNRVGLEVQPDRWLVAGCRFRIVQVGSVKKSGGKTIVSVNIDDGDLPQDVQVATAVGNAVERERVEAMLAGRRHTTDDRPSQTMPALREGDFLVWPV